jgi:hypothetical protein
MRFPSTSCRDYTGTPGRRDLIAAARGHLRAAGCLIGHERRS